MKHRVAPNRIIILVCLLAMVLQNSSSTADEFFLDDTPSGIVGLSLGPAMHTGRTHVVDGISGATQSDTIDDWKKYNLSTALVADMGIPTFPGAMEGTLGFRFLGEMNVPSHIGSFAILARYRFRFRLQGARLSSIEPWVGVGVGFHVVPFISKDVFVQLPLAAGCDFGIWDRWLFTSEVQLNSMNPIGPIQHGTTDDGPQLRKPRYDNYVIRFGIAYRFY